MPIQHVVGDQVKVEAVVRGYIAGSGWAEYQRIGSVSGNPLPEGLLKSSQLLEPIFTPSTKAEPPEHDAPMTYEEMVAVATLLFGAVFERHPDVDICISHGGGGLPYFFDRLYQGLG